MTRYREHTVFAAIVALVIGAIAAQMSRADAVILQPAWPPVVKTIVPQS